MGSSTSWSRLRIEIFERDDYTCQYCGKRPKYLHRIVHGWSPCGDRRQANLHVDHMTPRSRGGRDVIGNLVTACAECNLSKHANLWVAPVAYCRGCGWFERGVNVDVAHRFDSYGPEWYCERCCEFIRDNEVDEIDLEIQAWDKLALEAA